MTNRPIGYGIDFGTSNSAVAIAYADRVEVVPDLTETFGAERLEQRDAFTAVVHGLGVRAQQLWSANPLPA